MSPQTQQTQESLPAAIAQRFRVDGLLGRGGMGEVYRVHDTTRGRALALKLTLAEGSERERARFGEMLAREYRTLAQLRHPSVVAVEECGVCELGPYYTMELLEGSDLHELAPLTWRQACTYVRDIASCLALLHSRKLLHRDVSPRNLRCVDGRAKLLDFGALTPMGPVTQIVGTPPLVPPEALQRAALDGRSDLYALGATLYWALTRHHAYPARELAELPRVWEQRPAPPSVYAPDVPEALDALVMSLLSQEVQARPRSAAEVMERLRQIAGLPDDEHLRVTQSYLTLPSLQGRERELAAARDALAQLPSGPSRALWVEGESGIGRSRLLDAMMLDAQLTGASALRLSGADVAPKPLAGARALLSRAVEVLPQYAQSAGSPQLLQLLEPDVELSEELRGRLASRVRAFLRHACARGPLLLAVDDADLLDGPTQALLANVLRSVRKNLVLVIGARLSAPLDHALAGLRAGSEQLVLGALSAAQTEALLGSVFGDVPYVPAVAARVHALSHGNPRVAMELAEHLVATGKARYEAGSWVLPSELSSADLPAAWSEAFDRRVLELSEDARELAEWIAFSPERAATAEELIALSAHGDAERAQLAIDALLAAGLARLDGAVVRLSRGAYGERVRALTQPARVRALHARLARHLLERKADSIAVARCHLRAGDAAAAIDALLAELARGSRCETAPADYAQILEHALSATTELGRPRADRFALLRELARLGDHLGVAGMPAHFAELFAQLRRDSGLDDYEALPDSLEPLARLQQAFGAAQARYDAAPAHERVLPPVEAISVIAMTARQAAAFGAVSLDFALIESLPALHPFAPLSDALRCTIEHTFPASAHLTAGRYEEAREGYLRTIERLTQPDRGGLDEEFWRWSVNALSFALGHVNAGLGVEEALKWARRLEKDPTWVSGAWDVRRAYHLRQGDWREAEACRDRIERLRVQSDRRPPMVDTSARLELDTSAHAGDLLGVRRATERLKDLIALHPGYAPYASYGPAVYEHLRGRHELALQHIDRALSMVAPGRHPTWPWIAGCKLEILLAMDCADEAKFLGLRYAQQAEEARLRVMAHHITVPLALAEARLGDFERAIERVDEGIAYREQLGIRGLNLGWAYEARARLAISMRDQATFSHAASVCAREYGRGRGGSSLASRYEALRAEAQKAGLLTASQAPPPPRGEHVTSWLTTLGAATAAEDRFTLALQLLVNASGALGGALYRNDGGDEPVRCAATLEHEPPLTALTLLRSALGSEVDELTATCTSVEPTTASSEPRWLPFVLGCPDGAGQLTRTGAALLLFPAGSEPGTLPIELVDAVGQLLSAEAPA